MSILKSEREKFSGRYSGAAVTDYEGARQGEKWDREEEVFDAFYGRIAPKRVLDCPVGTGRFLGRYVRDGIVAIGVDLSDDMLAEAGKKIPPGTRVELRKGDVLNPAQTGVLGRDHDLIVCVRFLYAVPKGSIPVLLANFKATGARHLLLGVRLWPEGTGWGRYLHWHFWNESKGRPRWRGRFNRYIAPEKEIHRQFAEGGWEIVARESVQDDDAVARYFYLLRNRQA